MKLVGWGKRRWYGAVGVAAASVIAITGCGSSSKSTSPTTAAGLTPTSRSSSATSASSPASPAPAGAALKIGVIASISAAPTGPSQDVPKTVSAWVSWTNSHGGVDGHKVDVVVDDDRGDVAQSVTDAKGLAQDKSVLAVIDDTSYDTAWASVPGPAGLPAICGSETGNGFVCQSNAAFFPSGNTVIAGVSGQTLVSKLLNMPKWGVVYCSELPACAQAVPINKMFAKLQGVQVVYAEAASESLPNYTAQCLGLKDAGAQVVFGYAGGTTIGANCAAQGYHPVWVVAQGAFDAQYRTDGNYNGTVGPLGTWPWFVNSTPAQNDFRTAMAKYWPNFDSFTSPYTATSTWAALQLFAAAAEKAGPNPTRADVLNGVYSLGSNFTLGGLIPPETIVQGKPTVNPCFYMVGIKNQQYVQPFGSQLYCQPS